MGILNFYLGIGSLESFVASLLPFVTGSHDISSFLDLDRKPYLTTCGVRSRGCYRNGKSLLLVSLFLIDCFEFYFFSNLFFVSSFAVANYPLLEEHYQGRIEAALEFALTIDNFVELVDPRRLYECCLGPKPSAYVLKEIALQSRILVLSCLYLIDFHPTNLLFAEMATRYNKDKYARVKNLKNEPLSLITPGSKKRKLDEGKNETPALQSLFCTPCSPTPSLKMITFNPPITRSKGKAKVGKSVWDDPTTTLGRAHNVIIDNKLKDLSSISSHELVNCHIHKLMQVFRSTFLHHLSSSYTC